MNKAGVVNLYKILTPILFETLLCKELAPDAEGVAGHETARYQGDAGIYGRFPISSVKQN